jgi:hypothetical protein
METERGAGGRWLHSAWTRRLLLAVLLFGPLVTGELWARRQLELIYPELASHTFTRWGDAKLGLLQRSGCPRLLALGSSLTNRLFTADGLIDKKVLVDGELERINSLFDFGLNGSRATMMYGVWREIQAQGCTPEILLVEVSPTVVNGSPAVTPSYSGLLSLGTLMKMPSGFVDHVGLEPTAWVDLATVDRSHLHRKRASFVSALLSTEAPNPRYQTLALDGVITIPTHRALSGDRLAKERAERLALAVDGTYEFSVEAIEVSALRSIIREASQAGARVVLHAPPLSSLYHEIASTNAGREFAELPAELTAPLSLEDSTDPIDLFWCYDNEFSLGLFSDWTHLNSSGGRIYIGMLLESLASPAPVRQTCTGERAG